MSYFYQLEISYFGKGYQGWQKQAHTEKTIQGQVEKALRNLIGESFKHSIGSGRTDSGVHAISQVVRLELLSSYPEEFFLRGLNNALPSEILIKNISECSEQFHPVFSARNKTYSYLISKTQISPFFEGMAYFYPKVLNVSLLKDLSKIFVGEHDFKNYMCEGTPVKSTVREILSFEVEEVNSFNLGKLGMSGEFIEITVKGSGFLKQMVRLLVGALIYASEGKMSAEDMKKSLTADTSERFWPVAPACGLYLLSVEY